MPDVLAKPARWWPGIRQGHPLATDLIVNLTMSEGQGGKLYDNARSFPLGHDGTLVGGPPWGGGLSGTSVMFNGVDQYALNTDMGSLFSPTYPITLMAYGFMRESTFGGFAIHLVQGGGAVQQLGIGMDDNPDVAWMYAFAGAGTTTNGTIPANNKVTMIVGVFNSATDRTLYTDGRDPTPSAVSRSVVNLDQYAIGMARDSSPSGALAWDAYGAKIWKRSLTADEVAELWADPYTLERPRAKTYLYATGGAPPSNTRRYSLTLLNAG